MKKIKFTIIALLVLTTGFFAVHCQHDDSAEIPINGPDEPTHGTEVVNCTNCNTVPSASNIWYHDKSHSNVGWETQYKVYGSLLTGRFNEFFMTSLAFDEAHPETLAFEGYVRLNTCNTGEPNRDTGCLLTSFGTKAIGAVPPDDPTNKATLKTIAGTGKYSSDGSFLVDAEFTFLGITKTVTIKLRFAPKYDIGTAYAAGFNSTFDIKKADFLPNDTNIGDVIKITINSLMRIKK
ncbi:YceI family protein [Solitalea sp. MAHUQ-68]|uniref:YceI family protein n=1 Tax=Solitalea agri TaxID=2953739 RepID=A0A9X2F059_9SPHI|nr:YceI family protein [Solitalea agri]MCO4291679.1 YceI family protein [Solitalea agri]